MSIIFVTFCVYFLLFILENPMVSSLLPILLLYSFKATSMNGSHEKKKKDNNNLQTSLTLHRS